MAKRAIKRAHLEPWTPENRDQLIDQFIKIAGELPTHQFQIQKVKKGKVHIHSGSAREKLHDAIEWARISYDSADDGRRRRSATQLLSDLRRIESAAHKLLMVVGPDTAAARGSAWGLGAKASNEVGRLRETLEQAELSNLRHSLPRDMFSASGRVQTALDGVEALRRWAKAAAEDNLMRIDRMRTEEIDLGHGRHRGDVGLNEYIEGIVLECWCEVWGRQISDGPKLWKFVVVAASGIGRRLTEDASRERIRRIFGLRRAGRSRLDGDLPSFQSKGSMHRALGSAK